jgi:hypothetical protein
VDAALTAAAWAAISAMVAAPVALAAARPAPLNDAAADVACADSSVAFLTASCCRRHRPVHNRCCGLLCSGGGHHGLASCPANLQTLGRFSWTFDLRTQTEQCMAAAPVSGAAVVTHSSCMYIHVCDRCAGGGLDELEHTLTTSDLVARSACCMVMLAAALTASAATSAADRPAARAQPTNDGLAAGWQN